MGSGEEDLLCKNLLAILRKTAERENISSTQQCRGCSFPSFARLKKEIGICVTSSQKVLPVDRRLPGTISKVGE